MKTFREVAQSLSAEYSLRTRELRVFREGRLVVRTTVHEDDFWHGEIIDGVDVDFNLYKSEEFKDTYFLLVYPVENGNTITTTNTVVQLVVLNTYHCVATTIYGSLKIVCNLVASVEADQKPEQVYKEGSVADRYLDYFDSEQEALEFVAQARKA